MDQYLIIWKALISNLLTLITNNGDNSHQAEQETQFLESDPPKRLFTNRTYIHFVTRQKIKEFINYKKTKIAYPLDVFHNKKDEKTKENTIDSVLKNTIRSWSDVECHRILSKFLSKFLFGQIKFIPIEIERILNICDVKEKQELVK